MADSILTQIEREVSSWDGVTISAHRYGGVEFRVGRRELGHLHGSRLADLPFPVAVREELERDIPSIVALFRLNYDRPWTAK